MKFISEFAQNNSSSDPRNESLKDAGRVGVIGASIGGGALLGNEIGSRIGMKRLEKEYNSINKQTFEDENLKKNQLDDIEKKWSDDKRGLIFDSDDAPKSIREAVKGNNKKKKLFKGKRINTGGLISGGKAGKLFGAGIGALAGWNVSSPIVNNALPDDKYTNPDKLAVAQERRKELSHRNRTSEEARGWINTARRLSQM